MDQKLDEFVQKLKSSAAENLKAVALYGSAVTGEFHSKHSDMNLLCILEKADATRIEALHAPIEWWLRQGHRAPLVFTLEELTRSAFAALFRHVLIALGEPPAANKREAIERMGQFAHADPSGFLTILDFREGKRKQREIAVEETLERYFAFVEAVTDEFDRQLGGRNQQQVRGGEQT